MFDLVVIGSGPGGYVAAIRASQLGMNTAVIERSEIGGICLNWGCIPTKALLKSVQALHYAQHSSDYGFEITGEIKPDIAKIVERSRGVSTNMSRGIDYLFKMDKITVFNGSGKIVEKGKIEVTAADNTKSIVEAKNIIIATGARANSLPFAPIDGKKIISYRHLLRLKVWILLEIYVSLQSKRRRVKRSLKPKEYYQQLVLYPILRI